MAHIRDDRIINFDGDTERLIVEFLQKPDGDTTQEHLIDRLEKLIFHISMVANISDENFGTSSGIAMKYKLQAMSNLEKTKERKFTSGMNRRYRLIFSNPVSGMKKDDWVKIHPHLRRTSRQTCRKRQRSRRIWKRCQPGNTAGRAVYRG